MRCQDWSDHMFRAAHDFKFRFFQIRISDSEAHKMCSNRVKDYAFENVQADFEDGEDENDVQGEEIEENVRRN